MDNEWKQTPVRLSGAQPQNSQPRSHWTRDDRFLNFVPGAMMSFIIGCGMRITGGFEKSPLMWVALALSCLPLLADEYIIHKFKPDFKVRRFWQVVGMVACFIVIAPLLITPKCGFWDDKCKPVQHPVIHHVR